MPHTVSPPSTPVDYAYYRPVIPLLLSFIAGIIGALYFPGKSFLIASLTVPATGLILHRLISGKLSRWAPLILFACLGYFAFASIEAASHKMDHVARYMNDRIWEITGTIVTEPVIQTHRQKFILGGLSIMPDSGKGALLNVRGNIQVSIYGKGKELAVGNRIRFTCKIRPVRSFHNPGGFDYTQYMMWHNIWGNTYASSNDLTLLDPNSMCFNTALNNIRNNILTLINQASTGDAQAVLSALIIGDRRGLSPPLQEAFNRVGVSHVLSISGLHVGVVATAAFVFFKWILSFFRPLLLRAWTKKAAAICAVFPVIFYGVMAGMEPATQRSVIMILVFLMTFLIQREHDLFNTIAIAALAILIIDPPALFSISFQLSFAAVLSISWGMMYFQQMFSQGIAGKHTALKYAATLFCMTACAILGVAPLVMHYFNTFPLSGFLANLVVVPLMGSAVVIIGLFSVMVIFPFSGHAALWGLKICDWILKPVIDFIYYLSDAPFAAIKTITPSILEIICFYLLAGGIALYQNKTAGKDPGNAENNSAIADPPSNLPRRWTGVIIAAALIVLFIDIMYWVNQRLWHDDLRVTVLDVGQGNSAVLEFPDGKCMVIDGGGFGDNAVFDVGERVLAPFLWRNKIRTVDTVILTHPDADHLNGLLYILKYFHVKQVISTHQASDSDSYEKFLELIRKNAIDHAGFAQIQRSFAINGATMEILHPDADFMKYHSSSTPKDVNDNSIVCKAGFGGFSILFPGDIMEAAERDTTTKNPESLAATILVAPHHGSKTSSSESFLDAVNPEMIIISSGKEDKFPSESVLERYENREIPVFRTDSNGAVRVVMDEKTMSVEPTLGKKLTFRH